MQYDTSVKKPVFTIAPGTYPATVIKAEEKTSKAGNPMMVVEIEAYTPDGKSKFIKDYIVLGGEHPNDWRLDNLAKSVGLTGNGEVNADDLNGKSMNVKVGLKPARGDFAESNDVRDYYKPEAEDNGAPIGRDSAPDIAPAQKRPAPVAGASAGDDMPPFAICQFQGA